MKYTDYYRNKISKEYVGYLNTPRPFLIKESEIEFYKKCGDGFKSLEFVGYLNDNPEIP